MQKTNERRIILFPTRQSVQMALFEATLFRTETENNQCIEEYIILDSLIRNRDSECESFKITGKIIRKGGNGQEFDIAGTLHISSAKESFIVIKSNEQEHG